ncbi:hypothetical protein SuUB7_20460 [Streptococcus uberis]
MNLLIPHRPKWNFSFRVVGFYAAFNWRKGCDYIGFNPWGRDILTIWFSIR